MKERLGILISGSGSTMGAVIGACNCAYIKMDVACIVTSNPECAGIKKARIGGIHPDNIIYLDPKNAAFPEQLLLALQTRNVTVVSQMGWMPKTPENVISAYSDKIFNQHPGPLPEFGGKGMYGLRVHAAVLLYKRLIGNSLHTEVVVHRVEKDLDTGVIVKKRPVEIMSSDTPETLRNRAILQEHRTQGEFLKDIVAGTVWEYPKGVQKPLAKTAAEKMILEFSKKAAIKLYPNG